MQTHLYNIMTYTEEIRIDWRDRRLISTLYLQQEVIIRVGNQQA